MKCYVNKYQQPSLRNRATLYSAYVNEVSKHEVIE